MIDKNHAILSTRKQCELLSIWRSSVYYSPSQPSANETVLANEIHDIWLDKPAYGYRKITEKLRRKGYDINEKRVLRLMRNMRIQAMYQRPRTSMRNLKHKVYPYLLRDLEITRPNQAWATDITYIKMPKGFVYLVCLIDLSSRFIVGWELSNTLEAEFCIDALHSAFRYGKPDIINSDQGSQFTGELWVSALINNNIQISMDGKGRWVDNVIIERFWRTIKYEHILLHVFESVRELKLSIEKFINQYNYERLHQSLGYNTPAEMFFKEQDFKQNYILN